MGTSPMSLKTALILQICIKNKILRQLIIRNLLNRINNCKINLNSRQIRYKKAADFDIMEKVFMPGDKFTYYKTFKSPEAPAFIPHNPKKHTFLQFLQPKQKI